DCLGDHAATAAPCSDIARHLVVLSAISCLFSFLFFFYCHRDPRDLHSFPTRRSSDLFLITGEATNIAARLQQAAEPWAILASDRSEEHTSEFQSPYDLVCRLLLEKKKRTVCPPD